MSSENPLVSVIVPSYNHGRYVADAINSVINQTYEHLEIIVCDDGSSDNSREVINSIQDSRLIKLFNEKNIGATPNTNKLISMSKGKYIALMTSDDIWHPDKIQKQVEFLERNPEFGAVFTDVVMVNEEGKPLTKSENQWVDIFTQENRNQGAWLRKFFYEMNCLCHPSILIKKAVYDRTNLFNPALRQLPDFKMWIDIVKFTKIHVLPDKLVTFRILQNDKNTSADTSENYIRTRNEINLIMKDFFENMSLELLLEGFRSDMIHTDITSEIEMKIEQAFLYLKMPGEVHYIYEAIAMEKLYELIIDEESSTVLKSRYNYDFRDFFNMTGQSNYKSLKKFEVYHSEGMSNFDKLIFILKKIKKSLKI